MHKSIVRKSLVVGLLLLFVGASITPSMSSAFSKDDKSDMASNVERQLVAWWSFNESSGDILYDLSGNGHHGTIYGATWTTGVSGSALYFNGSGEYVQFSSPVLNVPPYSVCAWVNPSSYPPSYSNAIVFIVCNGGLTGGDYGFYLSICSFKLYVKWEFGARAKGSNQLQCVSQNVQKPGNWHFLVGTWDGSTQSYHVKLYRDGAQVGTYAIYPIFTGINARNLSMGVYPEGQWLFYHGMIDEVRIYNYVLSDAEIRYLYHYPGGGDGNPMADFNWSPWYPNPGQVITFDASASYDFYGNISTWLWDFGDGAQDEGELVTYQYLTSGVYNVTLTVIDDDGNDDSITKRILIGNYSQVFIYGRIVNRTKVDDTVLFDAGNIRVIAFRPFSIIRYKQGERFTILDNYEGFIGNRFVFASCMMLV